MSHVGLLHPGQMGAFIGSALAAAGHDVLWASAGRSEETRLRAAKFRDVGSVEVIADAVGADPDGLIVAICPPAAALDVARQIAATGYCGRYLDANAIAPGTVAAISQTLRSATVVDAAVIGGPRTGSGVLHLSGPGADEVARYFDPEIIGINVMDGAAGTASALKACYAASTKAVAATMLAARAAAAAAGIEQELLAEWDRLPVASHVTDNALTSLAGKAWRFVGEMDEAALFFADVGVPDGFSRAAAETYERIADLHHFAKIVAVEPDEVLTRVAGNDLPRTLDHL